MSIYTNGYALAGVTVGEIVGLLERTSVPGDHIFLEPFISGRPYLEWMGREAEAKGFATGVYLETEYKLGDARLAALSLHTKGVLSLLYYQNMGGYGCSYYLGGKSVLERVSVLDKNLTDTDALGEFTGHTTQAVIEGLFERMTGTALLEAATAKGVLYEIKIKKHVGL
jgi:hypothetical protein